MIVTGKVGEADHVVAKIKHCIDVLEENVAKDPECKIIFVR